MVDYTAFIGQDIEFNKKVEDLEAYPEKGMRATVLSCDVSREDEDLIKVTVSYAKFDEYNKQFESSNYYDKDGNPVLNARQAGVYKETETLYTDSADSHQWCTLLKPEFADLITEWKKDSQDKGESYNAWATKKLIEAREQIEDLMDSQPSRRLKP